MALAATAALLLLAPSQASEWPADAPVPDAPTTPEPPAAPDGPPTPEAPGLVSNPKLQTDLRERFQGGEGEPETEYQDDAGADDEPSTADALLTQATDMADIDAQQIVDDLVLQLPDTDVNDVELPEVADPIVLFGGDQQASSASATTQADSSRMVDYATPGTIIASAAIATGLLLAWAAKTGGLGAASVVAGSNLAQAEAGRRVVPSPLFTRFQRETVLNHPKRGELYQLIADRPGVCLQNLCDETELSRTAVTHHLRLLEKQHLIVSKRNGRSRHYYQNGGRYGTEMKQAYAVLQNERSQAIADFIHGHPGAIQKSICSRLGIDASVAHWHAKRLEEANLIRTVRQGRTVAYFPSAPLEQIRQTPN